MGREVFVVKKASFLSVRAFCEKYNLNERSFLVLKSRGYYQNAFKKDGRDIYVDENYFIHKIEAKKRLWLRACNNYYSIVEKISILKLAKMLYSIDSNKSLDSWNMFLHENLFSMPSERITDIRINKGLYLFTRYSNWIIKRGVFRYYVAK